MRLRSKTNLRVLVAIASPSKLETWKPNGRTLDSIDVQAELDRARKNLLGIAVTELAGAQHVTLDAIISHLRATDFDVLYLVCHGALVNKEPTLWLEDENGCAKRTEGTKLAEGLKGLSRLPRLVVLASCQSAGAGEDARTDDEGVLAALGPRIAEAGVPAVIAMQGNVMQKTMAKFIPKFFCELSKDGQIDRAMTEARFEVRDQPDFWAPVLFTRLTTGRLWYEHRSGLREFDAWDGLIDQIRRGKCVPILGSGLLEPFVGLPRDIAHRWASKYRYPMTPSSLCDLPEVAQYLSITHKVDFTRSQFIRELAKEVRRRWPNLQETQSLAGEEPQAEDLHRLLKAARAFLRDKDSDEPHQVLAQLNCPLYLTTNPDHLLVDALRSFGKEPREELCRWREELCRRHEDPGTLAVSSAHTAFTVQQPLVYQFFGDLHDVDSLVLTEDDYFNYLISITCMQTRPKPSTTFFDVNTKLANSGLIFLGFRIHDWDFRVLIHFLNSQESRYLRTHYEHVAVQLDPEEGLGSDAAKAGRYLEKYFSFPISKDASIDIYWGSVEDFLHELSKRWKQTT